MCALYLRVRVRVRRVRVRVRKQEGTGDGVRATISSTAGAGSVLSRQRKDLFQKTKTKKVFFVCLHVFCVNATNVISPPLPLLHYMKVGIGLGLGLG